MELIPHDIDIDFVGKRHFFLALIHDVLVVIGALVLTQMPFDLSVLAALLTVVGFSINDTIIISDHVRENMRKFRPVSLARIINRSINETLSRTIITSGTTLMVLMALFLFGGHVIRPFAFTLIVGFLSGVYSTIYIAAPVVLSFEKELSGRWQMERKQKVKALTLLRQYSRSPSVRRSANDKRMG